MNIIIIIGLTQQVCQRGCATEGVLVCVWREGIKDIS